MKRIPRRFLLFHIIKVCLHVSASPFPITIFCFMVDDGDGWLSLFQLFGGNRATPTIHHRTNTTIIIRQKHSILTVPPHPFSTTTVVLPHQRTTVTSSIEYPKRQHFIHAECAVKLLVIVGIMRLYIGHNQICVLCVDNRLQDEII